MVGRLRCSARADEVAVVKVSLHRFLREFQLDDDRPRLEGMTDVLFYATFAS